MDAIAFIRQEIGWAHELLESVIQDVTQEQAEWTPPGNANPLGATYAHAVCAEDAIVQGLLIGQPALFESSWEGKSGVSEPQLFSNPEWARRVEVDLTGAREYAQAVYAATNEQLDGMDPADLEKIIDLSGQGFGEQSVAWVLTALVISHLNNMVGEISVLKGLQGAKGYPW
jgi:hypothetical protein